MKKTLEYYLSLPYRLEIIPDEAEGGYGARYPELPGCVTCSDTLEGVVANAQDAKRTWLEAALEDGIPIAEPKTEERDVEVCENFQLSLPNALRQKLSVGAMREGVDLNQYCVDLLSQVEIVPTSGR